MFLSHKKGLKRDGTTPTLLYGYGGFNSSLTPGFSPSVLAWMEMGGLYAVPNLRGGGEYGEEWHQAGTKLKKQNVFDDFIAAAEWLIAERYTLDAEAGHLRRIERRPAGRRLHDPAARALRGRPAGRRRDGHAPVPQVHDRLGVGRRLRVGRRPRAVPRSAAYSPLHNIKPGTCYPPTLITTADHDDRVVPAHSFKFAAALQAAQSCDNPILIRIETRAATAPASPPAR